MAEASRQRSSMKGRQPWIEFDLLNIQPEEHAHKFEGKICTARMVISENGEHFLEDGLHKIPAIIYTSACSDSSEGFHRQQLENGMAIKVLVYCYNIFRTKDGTFQFVICVDNWERWTGDLPGCYEDITNVNSLDTVKTCLQNCIMTLMRDMDSASPFLQSQLHSDSQNLSALVKLANQTVTSSESQFHSDSQTLSALVTVTNRTVTSSQSQFPSDSQNLSALVKLANQTVTSSQSQFPSDSQNLSALVKLANQTITSSQGQQQDRSLKISSQLNRPDHSSKTVSSKSIASALSSNSRLTEDISGHRSSLAPVKLVSTFSAALPQNVYADSCVAIHGCLNQHENIWQPNQELLSSHQSNTSDLQQHSSLKEPCVAELQQNKKSCTDAVMEQSISPTQLLELMGQETEQNNSSQKYGEDKLICPGTAGENEPSDTLKLVSFHGGKVCKPQAPTFEDLFVPSDQRKALALLQGWCSSDGPSQSSSSSPAYLLSSLSSSMSRKSSSQSLFSQPTLKEYKQPSKVLPKIGRNVSDQAAHGLMKENCLDNSDNNINDKCFGPNGDSYNFCDGQNSIEKEQSKNNSSSLFSDTEPDTSSSLDFCHKPNEDKTLQQQKKGLFLCYPAPAESCKVLLQGRVSESSDECDILKHSCNRMMVKCGHQISNQSQVCEINCSQKNTAETSEKQQDKNVDIKSARSHESSTISDRRKILQISNSDGTLDSETSLEFLETAAEQQNAARSYLEMASESSVIDLSSTDDIYMIAGHDNDSYSDNLVSSTDSEVTCPFQPCFVSTQIGPDVPETSKESYFDPVSLDHISNGRAASPEIILETARDQQEPTGASRSQDILNSIKFHCGNRNGQATDFVDCCNFSINGSESSLLCHSPSLTSQKSTNSDAVLKTVLKNVAAAINKGTDVKTNVAQTTQELQKIPVVLGISQKDEECHLPLRETTRRSKHSLPTQCSPVYAVESPMMQMRVVLTDVMKSRKRLFFDGQVHLPNINTDGLGHHPFTKRSKIQQTSSDSDGNAQEKRSQFWTRSHRNKSSHEDDSVQGKRNQYWTRSRSHRKKSHKDGIDRGKKNQSWTRSRSHRNVQGKKNQSWTRSRSHRNESSQKLPKFDDISERHIPKKHFSACVTEVGQHDQKIQEIKRLSEQPAGCMLGRRSSAQRRCQPSSLENMVTSRKFFTNIKKIDAGKLNKIQSMGQHIFDEKEKGKGVMACRTSEPPVTSTEVKDAKNSITTNYTTKITSSHSKGNYEKSTNVLSESDCETPAISNGVPSLFSFTACYNASDWRNIEPVLDSSSERESQENSRQCDFPLVPTTSTVILESQGFVPSISEVGERLEPHRAESLMANSENIDDLLVFAELDQSIATLVNYVCQGQFL